VLVRGYGVRFRVSAWQESARARALRPCNGTSRHSWALLSRPARPAHDHDTGFCKRILRQVERAALERALEQSAAELAGSQPAPGDLAAAGKAGPGAPAGVARGGRAPGAGGTGAALWVDRYRPRAYFDLLATRPRTARRSGARAAPSGTPGGVAHPRRSPMLIDLCS